MSISVFSPTSRSSWRSHHPPAQDFYLSQSISHVQSAGGFSGLEASTLSAGFVQQSGILSKQMLERGLSDLGTVGDGTRIAYLSLALNDYGLSDISLVSSFTHLQKLNLSSNNLRDLTTLNVLSHLTHLDVSHNKLRSVLDFSPPKNLIEANYAHNEIEEIRDLSAHGSLEKLVLDGNQITVISGVQSLSRLTHLSLAENRIESIANLNGLPLQNLNLSGNNITVIENLESLKYLRVIDLSGNKISRLSGLEGHSCLVELYLQENEVVAIQEVQNLKGLKILRTLFLAKNPVDTLPEYRSHVLFHLPLLMVLDNRDVRIEEKVAALNRFDPPDEVVAARDHRNNTRLAVKSKPANLRFSTLTRVDEPYPMLILCGPPGTGKGYFCRVLVEEFPSFFGLGVSHTTKPQDLRESHGRDYYFIDEGTFDRAVQSGEFLQTHWLNDHRYGLTMAAVEQVAQQGLACVTHMSLEIQRLLMEVATSVIVLSYLDSNTAEEQCCQGVLTMKNTHFEPRYILTLPLTPQIHEQRMRASGQLNDGEMQQALREVDRYTTLHQERPGFFDTAINADSTREGYSQLRALVMAYGDISPETPLSLTSLSPSTTQPTSATSSSESTPTVLDDDTRGNTPISIPRVVPAEEEGEEEEGNEGEGGTESAVIQRSVQVTPEVAARMKGMARTWSRPPSSVVDGSHPPRPSSGAEEMRRQGSRTPLSEYGSRHQKLIEAAVTGNGRPYRNNSAQTVSRPCTGMSKSGTDDLQGAYNGTYTTTPSAIDEEFSSEETEEHYESESTVSKLSSTRGLSPQTPTPTHSGD